MKSETPGNSIYINVNDAIPTNPNQLIDVILRCGTYETGKAGSYDFSIPHPSESAPRNVDMWKPAVIEQPPKPTGIEAMVCEDIRKRQQFGINKYGTTVADNPLSLLEWLNHAYQESLDYPIYLKRAIVELENTKST
jgi:hypothetical protein